MWSAARATSLFCITANSTVRSDGALVMGRGLAREAALRYPKLPYLAGGAIHDAKRNNKYGLLLVDSYFALFQVKYHWSDIARLDLIQLSTNMLLEQAKNLPRVDLNFPGIGNGRLTEQKVLPIIEVLPDNVHVWRKS